MRSSSPAPQHAAHVRALERIRNIAHARKRRRAVGRHQALCVLGLLKRQPHVLNVQHRTGLPRDFFCAVADTLLLQHVKYGVKFQCF